MLAFSSILLLLIGAIPVIACSVWARIDTRHQVFHPVLRAAVVAGCLAIMPMSLLFVNFVLVNSSGNVPMNVLPAVIRITIVAFVVFTFAGIVGLMSYLFAHGGRREAIQVDEEVRVEKTEETGNPYQPSSL